MTDPRCIEDLTHHLANNRRVTPALVLGGMLLALFLGLAYPDQYLGWIVLTLTATFYALVWRENRRLETEIRRRELDAKRG